MGDPFLNERAQAFGVAQVEHPHSAARDFVLVSRSNAATGGADCAAGRAQCIHHFVEWQHEVRAVAHIQPALHIHAVGDQLVDLGEQRVGIEHDAVADRAPHTGVHDPARNLVEDE